MGGFTLYGEPGWGSAIIEAQLAWYGLDFTFERTGDLFASQAAREKLARLNPLSQIPTLALPDGRILTESAAITLHLADLTGTDSLVPAAKAPERAEFLRWLIFIVANIYPTFTYADDPARFVTVESAQAPFRASIDAYRERLWGIVEQAAEAPWFLGERFSALDIYIALMTRWEPRRPWFATHCPRLTGIAERAEAEPRLIAVWRRNFPDAGL